MSEGQSIAKALVVSERATGRAKPQFQLLSLGAQLGFTNEPDLGVTSKWLANGHDHTQTAAGKVAVLCVCFHSKEIIFLKGTNTQHSGHMVQTILNKLAVEICFKSLVEAIGKVLLVRFS